MNQTATPTQSAPHHRRSRRGSATLVTPEHERLAPARGIAIAVLASTVLWTAIIAIGLRLLM